MDKGELILEMAREVGFDLVGIAPLAPPAAAEHFAAWLAAGRHGGMAWMERDRERTLDPRRILPAGRSIVAVGLAHSRPPVTLPGGGRIARYAAGADYHNRVRRLLRRLVRRWVAEGLVRESRQMVDAGPLLERSHAARAGLGTESKAANLLHPTFGPWFFLGEVIVDLELEPSEAGEPASCGSCRACLDVCPTGALVAPGEVDARRCVSYLTIEHRGPIPHDHREGIGEWAFGCDRCSEVCPWGEDAPDLSERFGIHPALEGGGLESWLATPEEQFSTRWRGSALQRPRREGLARNAALVLGNHPREGGREALLAALEGDPSPVVREAAAWALHRAHGEERGVRAALERSSDWTFPGNSVDSPPHPAL